MNRYLYIGHDLDAGYADGQASGYGKCYSGGPCYGPGPGTDQTPEFTSEFSSDDWSVMGEADYVASDEQRTVFSIEELSTVDFEDIPSVDD